MTAPFNPETTDAPRIEDQDILDALKSYEQDSTYARIFARVKDPQQTLIREKRLLATERGWVDHAIANDAALRADPQIREPIPRADAARQLLMYQGLQALGWHREAHALYEEAHALFKEAQASKASAAPGEKATKARNEAAKKMWEARAISQAVREITGGVEIHPGATIGENFFIDHGTGDVIGETAKIGNNVTLYHTVTLGANGKDAVTDKEDGLVRRHPKLGNGVTVSTGTKILGPATIGNGVAIGSGVLLKGEVTLEDGAHIGSNVLIKGNVTIGAGSVIKDGVTVTQDIPAGMIVYGSTPTAPGILENNEAGAPIMVPLEQLDSTGHPKSGILAQGLEYCAKGVEKLLEIAQGTTR